MNLKQADLENKLAGLRKKWTKATRSRRKTIEIMARPLKLALSVSRFDNFGAEKKD